MLLLETNEQKRKEYFEYLRHYLIFLRLIETGSNCNMDRRVSKHFQIISLPVYFSSVLVQLMTNMHPF